MEIDEKSEKIKNLLERGVENIYPNREFLEKKLKSEEKLKIYFGIDPTGPTLHLGHFVTLKKLKEFQDLGHKIIILIGDFTAMIGDPTDKDATRKSLSREDILNNLKLYKKQVSKIIDLKGKNKAEIKYNSKWLSKLNLKNILDTASLVTVDQMLKRDMFENRIKEGKPIYIHEFLYPLLQGYDSVSMDVDGEIGGNDQTFNMLMGRSLMKQITGKEKIVLSNKLLVDSNGKKMGKTDGNMLSLIDGPDDMFGKVMSWRDEMIIEGFLLCTDVPSKEIKKMEKKIKKGDNPMELKNKLAFEIVSVFYGFKKAKQVKNSFIKTFSKKIIPEDIKEMFIKKNTKLVDLLIKEKIVSSKGEFRRLVEQDAIETNSQKITDYNFCVNKDSIFKIGKKKFIKIKTI